MAPYIATCTCTLLVFVISSTCYGSPCTFDSNGIPPPSCTDMLVVEAKKALRDTYKITNTALRNILYQVFIQASDNPDHMVSAFLYCPKWPANTQPITGITFSIIPSIMGNDADPNSFDGPLPTAVKTWLAEQSIDPYDYSAWWVSGIPNFTHYECIVSARVLGYTYPPIKLFAITNVETAFNEYPLADEKNYIPVRRIDDNDGCLKVGEKCGEVLKGFGIKCAKFLMYQAGATLPIIENTATRVGTDVIMACPLFCDRIPITQLPPGVRIYTQIRPYYANITIMEDVGRDIKELYNTFSDRVMVPGCEQETNSRGIHRQVVYVDRKLKFIQGYSMWVLHNVPRTVSSLSCRITVTDTFTDGRPSTNYMMNIPVSISHLDERCVAGDAHHSFTQRPSGVDETHHPFSTPTPREDSGGLVNGLDAGMDEKEDYNFTPVVIGICVGCILLVGAIFAVYFRDRLFTSNPLFLLKRETV